MGNVHATADVADSAVIADSARVWHYAQVRENASLGENVIVGRGAYVGTGVEVGDNCKIQNYALVYEPAKLARGVFIGPAVVLTIDHFPRAINADGSLTYTFVESVKATYPFYVIRVIGGLLYLIGMLIMAWNTVMTVRNGRPVEVRIPAVGGTPAHA